MPGLFDKLLRRRKPSPSVSREVAERASDHLIEMDDALEALSELPGLEGFSHTRELPSTFFELWDRALAAYDRYVEIMTGPGALEVSCEVGCTACCHDVPTGVEAVELLAIYARYREFEDFAELHDRALLAEEAFETRRRPCVFLGEDQRCRIYDRRPLSCRMHHATTDPSWCWADHERAKDAITPRLEPPADMRTYMRTIAGRLGLELPTTLFAGLGVLDGEVMKARSLKISDETKSKRRSRPME